MRVNVRDYGAKGDGVADDTAALLAARDAIASTTRSFPWGARYGGGVLYVPDGKYRCTQPLSLTPVLPTGQRSLGNSIDGDGRMVSVLDFAGDGVIACDTPGVNVDCCTRVSDVGVLSPNTAIRITGGGQCTVERAMVTGALGVQNDASDGVFVRDVSFYGTGTGVQHIGAAIGALVESCQFNGPKVCVWHAGGTGHVTRGCISELGILARFTSGAEIRELDWILGDGPVPYCFWFDDQSATSNTLVAMGVEIAGGFMATSKIVRVEPHAVVYHLTLNFASSNIPAAQGAIVDNAGYVVGETYVRGATKVPAFARDPGGVHSLDSLALAGYVPGNPSGNGPTLPLTLPDGTQAWAWHLVGSPTGTGGPVYFATGHWRNLDGSIAVGA